ncbi:C40 family peptidase [Macrococcus capreoli]|uniref:C40 family peptidase n=1 Tax=Macrococcus capreoli TaxID=2982690 RepID=UPI0021D5BCB1|nr:C40 family peptidase [Macrococcus sp. TMW 2.2395]MCU7556310.1 NlpC/P60 family protein [Macrococcus sp. TMW 2.2395]
MKRILLSSMSVGAIILVATQARANTYHAQRDASFQQPKQVQVATLKQINPMNKQVQSVVKRYRVHHHDTVQSVAKRFNIETYEVRLWNKLSTNTLKVGDDIIVSEQEYRKLKHKDRQFKTTTPTLSPQTAQFIYALKQDNVQTYHNEPIQRHSMRITLEDEKKQASLTEVVQSLQIESEKHIVNDSKQSYQSGTVDNKVARIALQIAQGKVYVYGANDDKAVDCSSFAQQVLAALGKSIPRTTYAQIAAGQKVDTPQPGDLVFFNDASHVGVYIGNGQMVDALNPEAGVGQRAVNYVNGTITGYYRY